MCAEGLREWCDDEHGQEGEYGEIMMIASSKITKVGGSVRRVPRPCGAIRRGAIEPASASTARIGMNRPRIMTQPPARSAKVIPCEATFPARGWMKPL